jgi:hypothetical protein
MSDPTDPVVNCILEVCCEPQQAVQTMAETMSADLDITVAEALEYCKWVKKYFDLAPKNTTGKLFAEIARLARIP